jgi:hypothetical protein
MILVALAAVNFAVLRMVLASQSVTSELMAVGVMPIASVLTIGLMIGYRHPRHRAFLLGFEIFGAMTAVLMILAVSVGTDVVVGPYVFFFIEPVTHVVDPTRDSLIYVPIAYSIAILALGLPQMAVALFGGVLSRTYRIAVTITRRTAAISGEA